MEGITDTFLYLVDSNDLYFPYSCIPVLQNVLSKNDPESLTGGADYLLFTANTRTTWLT
jgi:hypothetical protein